MGRRKSKRAIPGIHPTIGLKEMALVMEQYNKRKKPKRKRRDSQPAPFGSFIEDFREE